MKPFSQSYVLRETLRHIERAVAISTQKTVARMPEFKDSPDKLNELMSTLSSLSKLQMLVDSIRIKNKTIIGEEE